MKIGIPKEIKQGENRVEGKVTYKAVADVWGLPYEPVNLD